MKKLISAIVLATALLAGPALGLEGPGVPMPATTFSGAAEHAIGATLIGCANGEGGIGEIVIATLQKDGHMHKYLWSPDTKRILWLVYKDGATFPTAVGIGKTDDANHDVIPAMEWITFEETQARFPHPCDALFLKSA